MKKFSVLIALALLAVAGTGYAVTCSQDNVAAATLLVPYWKVSRNGSTGGDITDGGVNTFVALTNVSSLNIIVHATLWNKYSKAILDWNIPMTGFDVVAFTLRDVLNGHLNSNSSTVSDEVCGTGDDFERFLNPDATDLGRSISVYNDPAYSGSFRRNVWDSVDENGDARSLTDGTVFPYNDTDNPGCGAASDQAFSGDFSGYLTFDVVNYCTNFFPDEAAFYNNDAIATVGWFQEGQGHTPNTIMGDVFFIDPSADGGNISGDPMVSLEFDIRLDWNTDRTFYGRYNTLTPADPGVNGVDNTYGFVGDGREPLGEHFGFRYVNGGGLRSWALIYRSDRYFNGVSAATDRNLCGWYLDGNSEGRGFWDADHKPIIVTFDLDENVNQTSGGPSGDTPTITGYIFLESQRLDLQANSDINPTNYSAGWIDMTLPGFNSFINGNPHNPSFLTNQNQAWVGIQHSGTGLAVSVGHTATNLDNQFLCSPAAFSIVGGIFGNGNETDIIVTGKAVSKDSQK